MSRTTRQTNAGAATAEPTPEVASAIAAAWGAHSALGPSLAFLYADAAMESRFNPRAKLDTIGRTDLRAGTIPERSLGLYGINVNPLKPVGRARIAKLTAMGRTIEDLYDPAFSTGFFLSEILLPVMAYARNKRVDNDPTTPAYWEAVRVYMAAMTLNPRGEYGSTMRTKFRPVLTKWLARFPL